MLVPKPRGAFSEALFESLRGRTTSSALRHPTTTTTPPSRCGRLYELSLPRLRRRRRRAGVGARSCSRVRRRLERDLEARLRARYRPPEPDRALRGRALRLRRRPRRAVARGRTCSGTPTAEQVLDLLRLRSVYHLKEADPTAWVVPRLPVGAEGGADGAAVRRVRRRRPEPAARPPLRPRAWTPPGCAPEYGAYVDEAPLEILEQNNAMSLFGLHRRLRGAALGHLAAFEATSSLPSRRMAQGLERLGFADGARRLLHRARRGRRRARAARRPRPSAARCVEDEPALADDVFFGAFTCLDLEDRVARRLLDRVGRAHERRRRRSSTPTSSSARAGRCCCAATTSSRTTTASRTAPPVRSARSAGAASRATQPWCDGTHKVLPEQVTPLTAGRTAASDTAVERPDLDQVEQPSGSAEPPATVRLLDGPELQQRGPARQQVAAATVDAGPGHVEPVVPAVDREQRVLGEPADLARAAPTAGRR